MENIIYQIPWLLALFVSVSIVAICRKNKWPESSPSRVQILVRLTAFVMALAILLIGAKGFFNNLASIQSGTPLDWFGLIVVAGLSIGSAFYLIGVLKWYGLISSWMRKLGFLFMIIGGFGLALSIPVFLIPIVLLGILSGTFHKHITSRH